MKSNSIRVLVACEFSGIVREAFNSIYEVYAISCDLLPAEDGRVDYHYQGDIRDILYNKWDLMIAHPPCTRLCNSGVRWLKERNLWEEMRDAAAFFKELLNAPIPAIAVENPIPHGYAVNEIGRTYDQKIQPWQFGHGETKATCLWLKNLPKLIPTNIVDGRVARIHKMKPTKDRSLLRSKTYPGIAKAMAEQWVQYIIASRKKTSDARP